MKVKLWMKSNTSMSMSPCWRIFSCPELIMMTIILDVLICIVWLKNEVQHVCLEDQQGSRIRPISFTIKSNENFIPFHSGFGLYLQREQGIRRFYCGEILLEFFLQSVGLFGGHIHHGESNLQLWNLERQGSPGLHRRLYEKLILLA